MCGRFTATDLSDLATFIAFVNRAPFFTPRCNIAPRQSVPVILLEHDQPVMKLMRWGLIPAWAKDEGMGDRLINARAETLIEKPSFRKPYERQRCLVPADGFYEWQTNASGDKIPFRFTMKDKSVFCFAGLWDRWIRPPREGEFVLSDDGDTAEPSRTVETFSIITTAANKMVARVHDRMPVILQRNHYDWWIDTRHHAEFVRSLIRSYPAEDMDCYRVSALVNNARNESPECLKPA